MHRSVVSAFAVAFGALGASVVLGQRADVVATSHPAIEYGSRATTDAVAALNRRIEAGELDLTFEPISGYLRSVLAALQVPIESQTLVYSETSLQAEHITKTNPRALFFNDTIAVGWVRGTDTLEVSAQDPQQGPIFYQLKQSQDGRHTFNRSGRCLECHLSTANTSGVPGLLQISMLPMTDDPNEYAVGWPVDHRTPIADRWGGWYVTGKSVPTKHLGNVPVYHAEKAGARAAAAPKLDSVEGAFDAAPYPSRFSDVAALMVLNHQARMMNLITRMNWVGRVSEHAATTAPLMASAAKSPPPTAVAEAASELVDYLLFVEEAPLPGPIEGSSGFAEKFAAAGPRDGKGRSLRELDLQRRLLRYPCSYMVYTPAFDALPATAKTAVYERLWQILSGLERDPAYTSLERADRRAIVEILRDTKKDLPSYFQPDSVR